MLPVYLHRAEIGDDTPDSGGAFRDYDALIYRLTTLHSIEAAPKKPFAFDADAQEGDVPISVEIRVAGIAG